MFPPETDRNSLVQIGQWAKEAWLFTPDTHVPFTNKWCMWLSNLPTLNEPDEGYSRNELCILIFRHVKYLCFYLLVLLYKGNNKITEIRTILQKESQNS